MEKASAGFPTPTLWWSKEEEEQRAKIISPDSILGEKGERGWILPCFLGCTCSKQTTAFLSLRRWWQLGFSTFLGFTGIWESLLASELG